MECNKEEAEKCKALSEANFKRQDLVGAKKYALKARRLFPELEGLPQLLSILEVHIAAHLKLKSGESNCYGILQVDFQADDNTIRKQYRKLALILHPDKNKAFGAEAAFKHISEAWSVLSDRDKKLRFDKRWREDMASPRVSTSRVNVSKSPNMNSAHQGQAHVQPQQRAHAHQQKEHVKAQQQPQQQQQQQQGHGQAHVQYQQGQGHAHAFQQQWQGAFQQQWQGAYQGQARPFPQQGHGQAHVQYQQGQGHAQGYQQQGHGLTHVQQQQWKRHANAYQGQGQGQAHVPRQQGQGQAHGPQQQERDQVRAPEKQGQSQGHAHQQGQGQGQAQTHGHVQQGQGQVHTQHQQEQGPVHAHRQQGQDTTQAQGRAHQAPVPQKHHAHEQHGQGQAHAPQQQGQGLVHTHQQQGQGLVHTHQQQGQGQVHVHQGQGQGHGHVQQGQGQVHAQHQQEQGPVHAHRQQRQDTTQAQGRAHQAPVPQKQHAHEQHVQHVHQQQGQGPAHTHQQQGQDPTQARDEPHQPAAPQNHHAEHNQAHPSKPSQSAFQNSKSTFWTACPSCRMQLEYERSHRNKNLCCPMCYKAFVSKEIAPVQGTVLWPRQSKPVLKTDTGIKSGLPDTIFDWIPSADSTLPSSVHSNKKARICTEDNLHGKHGQKLPETPAQPAQKQVELQQKGLGSSKKYELRKRVAMHAKEGLERHIARSKDVIAQKLSEEKERKAGADKVSAIVQDQKADKERSGLASGPFVVAAEKEGYVHNTEEKAIEADACDSRVRTRNSTGPCKEAKVSQEGPSFVKSKLAGAGISKVEALQRKRKLASPMDKSIEDQNEGDSTFIKWCESYGGSQESKVSDKSSVQVDVADEAADGCKMEVPDPDFHNFDGDRTEHHFATGQIWASYDDDDGMPRYYTRVNKILSLQPLKMQMNWLEVRNPSDETRAWLDSGFQHSCGDFQLGSMHIAEEVSTFSHLMSVDKGPKGGYKIYPRQGDVWAVYKDWEILKVKEDKRGYDMVEIVTAFDEDRGLQVSALFKVAGFKTIFERKPGEEHVKWIPPQELRRFSHQVPAHSIAAGEVPRIRVDCLELDPASTPMNLIYGKQ